MIKTIITMVVTAIAGLVGYLVSDSFRERFAQKQRDKVTALRPGETYSNATEAVEWVVPRTVMTQLVIANEGLR